MLDLSLQDVDRKLATRAFQMFIPIDNPTAGSSIITKIISLILLGSNRLGVRLTLPSLLNRIPSAELHKVVRGQAGACGGGSQFTLGIAGGGRAWKPDPISFGVDCFWEMDPATSGLDRASEIGSSLIQVGSGRVRRLGLVCSIQIDSIDGRLLVR